MPASLSLGPPRITLGASFGHLVLQVLDLRMEMPGIDRGLDEEILRVGELLPEFGNLDCHGQDEATSRVVHP